MLQTSQGAREVPEQASSIVLVAKALTKSDTGGRVILPRVSVESNLCFLIGFRLVLHASPAACLQLHNQSIAKVGAKSIAADCIPISLRTVAVIDPGVKTTSL